MPEITFRTYLESWPLGVAVHQAHTSLNNPPDGVWTSLVDGAYGARWNGSAVQGDRLEQGILLRDDRDDAYELVRYRIPSGELREFAKKGDYLYLRVKISACAEGFPMLRLLVQLEGRALKHDAVLNCQGALAMAKGGFLPMDVGAHSETDGLVLSARYHLQPE